MDALVEEFDGEWETQMTAYSRKFIEFCCSKALTVVCSAAIDEAIIDGSFSRFTFDMMLAWEMPSSQDEESFTVRISSSHVLSYVKANFTPHVS